jgi:hypothetical protein
MVAVNKGPKPQGAGVDTSPAGVGSRLPNIVLPPGEVVVSMRPVCVFANGPGSEMERLRSGLRGRGGRGCGP